MKREKGAGAVIFRKENGKTFFLLLHYHLHGSYWGLPRGHIEINETKQQAAKREIKEETGLEIKEFAGDFEQKTSWEFRWKGEDIFKEVIFFLAEAETKNVKISHEHLGFAWLEFDDAMKQLTYDNTKEILKSAHKFLQKA